MFHLPDLDCTSQEFLEQALVTWKPQNDSIIYGWKTRESCNKKKILLQKRVAIKEIFFLHIMQLFHVF